MSHKAKRQAIGFLKVFNAVGLVAVIIMMILFFGRLASNQSANHADTASAVAELKRDSLTNQKIIICMLKVPLAERTDDQAKGCRTKSEAEVSALSDPAINVLYNAPTAPTPQDNPVPSTAPATTPTPAATPSSPAPAPVVEPPVAKNLIQRIITNITNIF